MLCTELRLKSRKYCEWSSGHWKCGTLFLVLSHYVMISHFYFYFYFYLFILWLLMYESYNKYNILSWEWKRWKFSFHTQTFGVLFIPRCTLSAGENAAQSGTLREVCSLNSTVQCCTVLYWRSVISGRWATAITMKLLCRALRSTSGDGTMQADWRAHNWGLRAASSCGDGWLTVPGCDVRMLNYDSDCGVHSRPTTSVTRAVPLCPSVWSRRAMQRNTARLSVSCCWLMTGDSRDTFQLWHRPSTRQA